MLLHWLPHAISQDPVLPVPLSTDVRGRSPGAFCLWAYAAEAVPRSDAHVQTGSRDTQVRQPESACRSLRGSQQKTVAGPITSHRLWRRGPTRRPRSYVHKCSSPSQATNNPRCRRASTSAHRATYALPSRSLPISAGAYAKIGCSGASHPDGSHAAGAGMPAHQRSAWPSLRHSSSKRPDVCAFILCAKSPPGACSKIV